MGKKTNAGRFERGYLKGTIGNLTSWTLLKPKTISAKSKEIVVDETGTVRNGGMHNFIGESDESGRIDTADFTKIRLDSAAKLSFTITVMDAMKFTIWQLIDKMDKNGNSTYSLKSLQATTLKKESDRFYYADTKDLTLDAGTYYFSMESTNAKKGGSTFYNSVNTFQALSGLDSCALEMPETVMELGFAETCAGSACGLPDGLLAGLDADAAQDKLLGESAGLLA